MAYNIYSNDEKILVGWADRFSGIGRNGDYQSDLLVRLGRNKSRITISANQPIYPSDNGNGFELVSMEVREQHCFNPLRIKQIIFHDIKDNGVFARKVRSCLSTLENL